MSSFKMNGRRPRPAMSGTVTHLDDLQPAINKLTDVGREWLEKRTEGREVMPRDIALAADYERGELNE